jgi:hypothetical protein
MIIFFVLLAVALVLFGYRIYRTINYYREAHNRNISEEEKKIAYRNYIVHLVFCIVFIIIIGWSLYNLLQPEV